MYLLYLLSTLNYCLFVADKQQNGKGITTYIVGGCHIVVGHKSTEVIAHCVLLTERNVRTGSFFSKKDENATEIMLLPETPGQPLIM